MTTEQVREIVQANAPRLVREFGIPHWDVTYEYGLIDRNPDLLGQCRTLDGYEEAWISLYPEGLQSEKQTLEILEHELLHILHSPLNALMDAVEPYLPTEEAKNSIGASRSTAMERIVKNLERLVYGMRNRPESQVESDLNAGGTL